MKGLSSEISSKWVKSTQIILKHVFGPFDNSITNEIESCQETEIFKKPLIPSYNGDISILQWNKGIMLSPTA